MTLSRICGQRWLATAAAAPVMSANITRRGKSSWRLKFDVGTDPATGKRLVRTVTVRGKRQDAEKELGRLVNAAHDGTLVEPNKVTVAEYLRAWLDGA